MPEHTTDRPYLGDGRCHRPEPHGPHPYADHAESPGWRRCRGDHAPDARWTPLAEAAPILDVDLRTPLIIRAARSLLDALGSDHDLARSLPRLARAAADLRNVLPDDGTGTQPVSASERQPDGYLAALRGAAGWAHDLATALPDDAAPELDRPTLTRVAAGLAAMLRSAEARLGTAAHDEPQPTPLEEAWAREAARLADEARRGERAPYVPPALTGPRRCGMGMDRPPGA